MTCRMAAGKQKKRPTNSTYSEQYRPGKKPRLHSSNFLISLKSQIGLEWDGCQKRVVPKKEQIGILWSELAPFVESTPKHCSRLADVTYVPPDIFSLENLTGVLSYEVWSTCLTEAERKFLIQFLPSEVDPEENVHLLLAGENHHFGNPSLSWSSSICYGDIHPDAVLNKEKQVRAYKKAYRTNLHNYHSNIVDNLKKWRKRWLSCDDPENLFRDKPAKQKQGDVQSEGTKSQIPLKVEHISDVSKFMSYIEISRTQHNLVKSLKQSGDGIQSKQLTRVIGDLDKFHVKPYGTLIEDEQRRLREHWLAISCNELPAAFEVLRDRKLLMEKLRRLLGLELGEKNVSVMRKTDQLADITKELGQLGACGNDDIPDLQNGKVELVPQGVLHSGDDHSPSLEDQDCEETNYVETPIDHHETLNVKDEDLIVVNGTDITSQSEKSNVQNQDCKDISYADTCVTFSANNPDEQSKDLVDMKFSNGDPDVEGEGIKEISYRDKTINDHSSESKLIKSISYSSKPVHTLDSHNMQAQDLEGVAYAGSLIHAHEQNQGLKDMSYTIMSDGGHVVNNVPAVKNHPEMNAVIVDHEETGNTRMIPSDSSSLLSKSSREQIFDEFLDPNDQAAKGQQGSVICLENSILSQQQAQVTVASAFPIDNSASFMQPCSNRQSNGRLQTVAEDTGMLPYSLDHRDVTEQSTDLHSLVNNHLDQCAPFPSAMQAHPLMDGNHNGLYAQQIQNNLYSGAKFPTKGNPPIVEHQSSATCRPLDHRYNWFPEEHQSHNNWSGMASDNCLTQALPGGSNTDGSLFSALARYKQPSVHMQSGRLSPTQLLEIRNQVHPAQSFLPRTRDTNTLVPHNYGYPQSLPTSQSSYAAPVGSLNNMQWTNIIQQNPGMPDFMYRQFRGPWTR